MDRPGPDRPRTPGRRTGCWPRPPTTWPGCRCCNARWSRAPHRPCWTPRRRSPRPGSPPRPPRCRPGCGSSPWCPPSCNGSWPTRIRRPRPRWPLHRRPGSALAPSALLDRAAAAGVRAVTTYGMSETCGGCVYDGRPLPGVTVSTDEHGRISLAGPVVARGYRGRPGDPAFDRDLAGARRFRTDDLGGLVDGRWRVLGRGRRAHHRRGQDRAAGVGGDPGRRPWGGRRPADLGTGRRMGAAAGRAGGPGRADRCRGARPGPAAGRYPVGARSGGGALDAGAGRRVAAARAPASPTVAACELAGRAVAAHPGVPVVDLRERR